MNEELNQLAHDLRGRIAAGETTANDLALFDYLAGTGPKKPRPEPDLTLPDPFHPN